MQFLRSALVLGLLTVLLGCGGGGKPPAIPVKGKVMFKKDTPAAGAMIVFHPVQDEFERRIGGKPFAKVQEDGTFVLTTYEENDGAPEGEYGVSVDWRVKPKQFLVFDSESTATGKQMLKEKYTDPQKPFMKVTVKKGEPNDFLIEVD
ncbi:MAG: hypothetical protein SNJ75_03565 [Gemmataceae bacterium]